MDAIFALASARGKAGVSVVRVSGQGLQQSLSGLVTSWPAPRQAALRKLWLDSELLDQALVVCFPYGGSFTGEEVIEIHVHGSVAIVSRLLEWLGKQDGLRLAEAGEFTRRALMNGCIDLTQVEGLADLIDAETEAQRKQAMRVFSGDLAAKCDQWKGHLLKAVACLAAAIDFAEEDLPETLIASADLHVCTVLSELRKEVDGFRVSERIRDGFEVAILGLPNVGKSTLLNRIAGRDVALTSAQAGTTRDIVEVRMDLAGIPVTFLDTAGLRETSDQIESMGVERAILRAQAADLRVFLISEGVEEIGLVPFEGDLVYYAKDDSGDRPLGVSGVTGAGVARLLADVELRLEKENASAALITRQRHRAAVGEAIESLEAFRRYSQASTVRIEILSMYLEEALESLSFLMGKFDIEDVLGEIFSSFCIGK